MTGVVSGEVLPVITTREETRATYDRIARYYDLVEGYWERKARLAGIRALALRPGERVVEIGFGTGAALVELAQRVGSAGRVEGVDLSPQMIAAARRRLVATHLDATVSLHEGDAVELPFAEEQFDAGFMSFALELLPGDDIRAALGELRRVLRSGGRLCVVALSKTGKDPLMRRLYEWGHQRFPHELDCRPIYVAQSMAAAGFVRMRVLRKTLWGLPVEIAVGVNPDQGWSADP